MRFYEFATPVRPVLKISQQAQPAATPAPFPRNTAPAPIKVYPQAWQHEWIQKKLAADIAKSAQTVQPTEDDIVIANMRYAETQRATDDAYERTHNVQRINRRWEKRN
jgi:hypothetical protein